MKRKLNSLTAIMALILSLGWFSAIAQGDGCSTDPICATCNPTVSKVKLDYKFGNQYFLSSGVGVNGDACFIPDDPSAYIWTVTNASSYSVLTNSGGFARIQITSLPGCGTMGVPKPQVCLQIKARMNAAPTGTYTYCCSNVYCIEVPCN